MNDPTTPVREWGRTMVRLPDPLRNEVFTRATRNRRSMSNEILILVERGLAAEKAVDSGGTVYAQMKREEMLRG